MSFSNRTAFAAVYLTSFEQKGQTSQKWEELSDPGGTRISIKGSAACPGVTQCVQLQHQGSFGFELSSSDALTHAGGNSYVMYSSVRWEG